MNLGQFFADHWGDLASVVGLVIVIWASLSAKNAAEQARDAAREVKDRIAMLDTLADVSAALAIMEEIKRLQRAGAWPTALDRYSTLRRHLVRVEEINTGLTDIQLDRISKTIAQFRIMEAKVESAILTPGEDELDPVELHAAVSERIDEIERIMIAIKKAGA